MFASAPTFVDDGTKWLMLISVTAATLGLLWKIARSVGRVAMLGEQVAEQFDPQREGGTLPNQVQRIEGDVRRIADGIEETATLTRKALDDIDDIDSRVTTLETWKSLQTNDIEIQKGGKL